MTDNDQKELARLISEAVSRGVARALLEHFVTRDECRVRQVLAGRAWLLILGSYVFTAGAVALLIGLMWGHLAG